MRESLITRVREILRKRYITPYAVAGMSDLDAAPLVASDIKRQLGFACHESLEHQLVYAIATSPEILSAAASLNYARQWRPDDKARGLPR